VHQLCYSFTGSSRMSTHLPWVEIALPGILLLAKFALKLFVDRSATLPDIVAALLSLPVDIVFLAASLLAGYAITVHDNPKAALFWFVLCLVIAIFNVVFWRRSDDYFARDQYFVTVSFASLNYCLSVGALVFALDLLVTGAAR